MHDLTPNSFSTALKELLKEDLFTILMKDYVHMEKYGTTLPCNNRHISTKTGNVILSEGNLPVIYYVPNT